MGAREIDAQGQFTGRTWVNPDFVPQQPITAGMTFANHFELAFWRTFKGYNTIGDFLTALSQASLTAVRSAADPSVLDYWPSDDSPASTLPIFTSAQFAPTELPPERLFPLTGHFLLDVICSQPGVNIQFNPGGNLTAGLSGSRLTTWWNEWKQADHTTAEAR
jgi:hypothetical protein